MRWLLDAKSTFAMHGRCPKKCSVSRGMASGSPALFKRAGTHGSFLGRIGRRGGDADVAPPLLSAGLYPHCFCTLGLSRGDDRGDCTERLGAARGGGQTGLSGSAGGPLGLAAA